MPSFSVFASLESSFRANDVEIGHSARVVTSFMIFVEPPQVRAMRVQGCSSKPMG